MGRRGSKKLICDFVVVVNRGKTRLGDLLLGERGIGTKKDCKSRIFTFFKILKIFKEMNIFKIANPDYSPASRY